MSVVVEKPGALDTVQDLGRPGQGALGVPPGGAMDALALRIANRLLGQADDAAGLEFTLAGPTLRFEADAWVALAGSQFAARLDGRETPHLESFRVRAGQVLAVGRTREGARGVLAIGGGIDVPRLLGSRATLLSAGFGGLDGRGLRAGDRLAIGSAPAGVRRRVRGGDLPAYASRVLLRTVRGAQASAFDGRGLATFFASEYRVSPRSDRMGLRLEGPPVDHVRAADILPEGIAAGAIQIPADGQPIVLGADRPTTGGYTKIGAVAAVDLGRVAQAKPGDVFHFVEIAPDEARAAYRAREAALRDAVEEIP